MEYSRIHSDIIYEILSRASSDTLATCRVASKEWNLMSYDSKFMKIHSQMKNIVDGFVSPSRTCYGRDCFFASISDEICEIHIDFIPGFYVSVEAVSANHGIILCKSYNPISYLTPCFFVCKPQIKLFKQIPNPKTIFWIERAAIYVLRTNPFRYKILIISFSEGRFLMDDQKLISEVFDSETWMWKRLKDIEMPSEVVYKSWLPATLPAVTVCGAFHWLINFNLVSSFDVVTEEWKTLRLPVKKDEYQHIKLAEYEGKLAMICMDSEGYMYAWVLENFRNGVWEKKFAIKMKDPDSDHRTYTPVAFYGSDIIVVSKRWSLMYYDFKNGECLKEVYQKEHDLFCSPIFSFWSDSEPYCLRGTSELGCQPFEAEEEETQHRNQG